MTNEDYIAKVRSIGAPRRWGTVNTKVEQSPYGELEHTEHWDDRVDATVRPKTVEYKALKHNTGKRKNEVAEIVKK